MKNSICTYCGGSGKVRTWLVFSRTCIACGGRGRFIRKKSLQSGDTDAPFLSSTLLSTSDTPDDRMHQPAPFLGGGGHFGGAGATGRWQDDSPSHHSSSRDSHDSGSSDYGGGDSGGGDSGGGGGDGGGGD